MSRDGADRALVLVAACVAGMLLGLVGSCCHLPRGPQRCASAPTKVLASGACPIVDSEQDAGP